MTTDDGRPEFLVRLSRTNPTTVVLATAAVFLGVLLLPDAIGAVLVVAIATGLLWLLTRTWPVLPNSARVLRTAVLLLLLAIAAVKVFL
jgi:hypothetical protein